MKNFYKRLIFNQTQHTPPPWQWGFHRLAWLRPPCLLCGASPATSSHSRQLCQDCFQQLPWYHTPRCPQCALPTPHGEYCGICLRQPPAFSQTFAAFHYHYPLPALWLPFKYQQAMACGQVLIEAACTVWPQPPCAVDLLLAMPMHPHRLQQRGFNHAQQFATQLARHWQIPCIRDGVLRIRDSGPQAGLSKRARTRSLRGAFACTQSWQGLHVMLVDDVMTTGASMQALAQSVKQAGARDISALVLARTLKTH